MSLIYKWDLLKDLSNDRKHGIRFDEAQMVWADEFAIEIFDTIYDLDEYRYIRIGKHPDLGLLVIVFTEPAEKTIRIISARRATIKERLIYEERI